VTVIRRTLDPTNLNAVCNHPDVRPWLRGEGTLDVSDLVSNPTNYAFELPCGGGGFIVIAKGLNIYEVHSQFVPEARRMTLRAMRESMDFMFTRTDCTMLVSQFPDDNPAADAIGRKGGFKPVGIRDGDIEIRVVSMADWIADNSDLEADGERFHALLETAKAAVGSELPIHDHDPIHERFVGAALRMCERGNAAKGVETYNQWAAGAGYAAISLVSAVPPVVDAVDAIVSIGSAGDLEVLRCE
jgi:hypothetical protein